MILRIYGVDPKYRELVRRKCLMELRACGCQSATLVWAEGVVEEFVNLENEIPKPGIVVESVGEPIAPFILNGLQRKIAMTIPGHLVSVA